MSAPLYLDAVLRPHRSMTKGGMAAVLGVMIAVNIVVGVMFVAMGAPPIPVFLGFDVLLLWLALNASFRAADRGEHVIVSAETIEVIEEGMGAPKTLWKSATAFTRVDIDDMGEEEWRVRLMLSGKRLTLARALSPQERRDFGHRLQAAVKAARNERWPGS
jgi:uncharacterized membrane protein